MKIKRKLVREQVDKSLSRLNSLRNIKTPPFGWIRSIREALGMSGRQLAERLGVSKQSVSRLEQDENVGSITIKTLRNVAESLDCVFVYGFVPKTSLENTIRERADKISRERMDRVDQTMALEKQKIRDENLESLILEDVERIMDEMPRNLWD
ncbi:MAG: mobile mystery protein A [Thermodesulfobacteriota bacterium]